MPTTTTTTSRVPIDCCCCCHHHHHCSWSLRCLLLRLFLLLLLLLLQLCWCCCCLVTSRFGFFRGVVINDESFGSVDRWSFLLALHHRCSTPRRPDAPVGGETDHPNEKVQTVSLVGVVLMCVVAAMSVQTCVQGGCEG